MKLSVVIVTKDAATTLGRTLDSVQFADEIVVVDMGSRDATKALAKKYTDTIFDHADVGFVEPARNFSFSKAQADWILVVDADEVIPSTLQKYILELINEESKTVCYNIARKNILFGDWVKTAGWWPDFQPRLFRRGFVEWSEVIHGKPTISGEVVYLPKSEDLAIEHYNYGSISEFVTRLDRYTTIGSKMAVTTSDADKNIVTVFRTEFLQRLFALKGIEGGYRGILLSFLQGFSQVVEAAKVWELRKTDDDVHSSDAVEALREFQSQLAYWIADAKIQTSSGLSKLVWRLRRKYRV